MSAEFTKPRLVVDEDSQPFWDACRAARLLGQRCGACGAWRWPPRTYCSICHAAAPVWERLSGEGEVVGYAIVHRNFNPAFADELPLAIIHVALTGTDGAMVFVSNLVAGQWRDLRVGSRVLAFFDQLDDQTVLPKFKLMEEQHDVRK